MDDQHRHDGARWSKKYTANFANDWTGYEDDDNHPAAIDDARVPPEWGCDAGQDEDDDFEYQDENEEAQLEAFVRLLDEFDENDITLEHVQTEATAYFAKRTLYKGKGKGKGGKSKSSPFRKGNGKGSSLSLEDRRKRLAALKERSTCKACGRVGHWSGDAACPKRNQSPQPASTSLPQKDRTANVAVLDSDPFTFLVDEEATNPVAHMASKRQPDKPDAAVYNIGDSDEEDPELPLTGDKKFTFGQYKGFMFSEIVNKYPEYPLWGLTQKNPGKCLVDFLAFVEKNYDLNDDKWHRKKASSFSAAALPRRQRDT